MIAKGTAHNNGARLAAYLITGKDNERASLFELRGFASDDIREAFRSVHVMADATRAEQPFFHVQVRTPDGELPTTEQWQQIADRIESKLGLSDQPRAIAFHTNTETGHTHMHVAWSRIDDETMTARPLPFYKLRLKEVCRELEIEMGLTPVTNERRGPAMAPSRAEFEQARRLGIDIHQIRATIRDCWERSDDGTSFAAALSEKDLVLCRGDRRSYVVIDRAGGMHALGKRILGHSAAEVRQRLAELDQLPTVNETRAALGLQTRGTDLDELTRTAAIEERDAGALLESITKQRATFTTRDLDWIIGRHIDNPTENARFAGDVLKHAEIVELTRNGPPERYTTKAVLDSERSVLGDAAELVNSTRHEAQLATRASILKQDRYQSISREQVRALRHATGPEGLALISGQAGTGKSYTMSAIREVYEVEGYRVVGLGPTNVVADDMKESGFTRARTLHSELFAIDNGRTRWDKRTVVMVDEAAMIDTNNLGRLTACARATGAKLVLIGDDRQLSSIERGGLFTVLKDRHGVAELTEVRRQHAVEDREASQSMAKGNFREALAVYEKKGAIVWSRTQSEAADALIKQWAQDHIAAPSRSRFVFAYTNQDVDELNSAIRQTRLQRGELGESNSFETKHGPAEFAAHDRIQFTGTDKQRGICNGQAGTVQAIDGDTITVRLDGKRENVIELDATTFRDFRHGYAGTIYKGQGRTLDRTYLFHSEHWRAAASYVALTRHTHQTQLFVSRDTATDMNELVSQVARIDDRRAASHFLEVNLSPRTTQAPAQESEWQRNNEYREYSLTLSAPRGSQRHGIEQEPTASRECERELLHAADELLTCRWHGITDSHRANVLDRFPVIQDGQRAAFEHATEAAGLALVDCQTGIKSTTIGAIRTAYEEAGYNAIGLAPTNAAVEDMGRSGFRQTATVDCEVFALDDQRAQWDRWTVVIVDEATMLDAKMMTAVVTKAYDAGAKLILVGDDQWLPPIERGGMFGLLKDRYTAPDGTQPLHQTAKVDDRMAASNSHSVTDRPSQEKPKEIDEQPRPLGAPTERGVEPERDIEQYQRIVRQPSVGLSR